MVISLSRFSLTRRIAQHENGSARLAVCGDDVPRLVVGNVIVDYSGARASRPLPVSVATEWIRVVGVQRVRNRAVFGRIDAIRLDGAIFDEELTGMSVPLDASLTCPILHAHEVRDCD